MFLSLAHLFATAGQPRESVFLVHSSQLNRWLDEAWSAASQAPAVLGFPPSAPFLGAASVVADQQMPVPFLAARPSGVDTADANNYTDIAGVPPGTPLVWDHLIYAYVLESTGMIEVFAEVVRRLVIGETLGTLTSQSVQWLRTTEDLFFKDPPAFSIHGVLSEVRPHSRVNRRNAYWRMFGMDLPHNVPGRWGSSNDSAWKADIGPGVNADFRAKWNEFLRQVWLGAENASNTSGARPVDNNYILLLCEALRDMMNNRRRGGQLAREEFAYVTMLSWFHLTLSSNSPIVVDLQASATSPADRLAAIAQRVGMAPAARSRELFELAGPMSMIVRGIELDLFNTEGAVESLYLVVTPLSTDMRTIINNWQSATGERVKERPVGTVAAPQPLRVPTPSGNGTKV